MPNQDQRASGTGGSDRAWIRAKILLLFLTVAVTALVIGCGGGDDGDEGPTQAEARAAAQQLDSLIAEVPQDETLQGIQSCMNAAFDSRNVNRVAACTDVCVQGAAQCRGDVQALQTEFTASPTYVQEPYRAAYEAAVAALEDRATWDDAVGAFAAGFPFSTAAEDRQSFKEMNRLNAIATSSNEAVQPALDSARAAFETYVSGLEDGDGGEAPETTPTTETAPAPAPELSGYDGAWAGTTSQGLPISFTVEGGVVTQIRIAHSYPADCPIAKASTRAGVDAAIEDDSFTTSDPQVEGSFSSESAASGDAHFEADEEFTSVCPAADVTWEATRGG